MFFFWGVVVVQLMVNWWFGGLVVWDSNQGAVKNPNPFHMQIPGIQTTGTQTTNLPLVDGVNIKIK